MPMKPPNEADRCVCYGHACVWDFRIEPAQLNHKDVKSKFVGRKWYRTLSATDKNPGQSSSDLASNAGQVGLRKFRFIWPQTGWVCWAGDEVGSALAGRLPGLTKSAGRAIRRDVDDQTPCQRSRARAKFPRAFPKGNMVAIPFFVGMLWL